ncbi:LuxR C-terminal-related transcriptional regulator [Asticcacaulis sp. ZE23SCel15]|uniref:helix-turn-helix transcriptional regulator n=1 Tax=Asticcacaulis sp. ZE23SCel15 TaxID=3059027 RepID=UPI00266039B5|nr:LuxR C-terminal-related transcriptional regulator [Asticcacaulis sp. ZE23SCel15]WKL56105.1 LuxR C-terminal-related transcriptional regulator [Asticcacaulis sp. ZE23SCel15]
MPSYVRSRLLSKKAFILGELKSLRDTNAAFKPDIISYIRSIVPFDQFGFSGLDIDGCETGNGVLLLTDIPEDMFAEYIAQNLAPLDPIFLNVTEQNPVVSWHDLPETERFSVEARPLNNLLRKHRIAARTLITFWSANRLYGSALFTRPTPFSKAELEVLTWFAHRIHSELSAPLLEKLNERLNINSGEILCLEWASRGHTSEEIAAATGYTTETVNSYLKAASKKLKARNRAHAIADAIRINLIH